MDETPKKLTLADILPKYTLDDVIEYEGYEEDIEEAVADIDHHLERLQKYIERKLSDDEQTAVLDIVDENSTKDNKGYIILFFSFIQAWKIYEQHITKR